MNEDIGLMIEDCLNRESKLTMWEANFIYSISNQYKNSCSLSLNQIEKLDNIWERVT